MRKRPLLIETREDGTQRVDPGGTLTITFPLATSGSLRMTGDFTIKGVWTGKKLILGGDPA